MDIRIPTNRMHSTRQNVQKPCHVKYSKRKKLNWGKWLECHCVLNSITESDHKKAHELELHSLIDLDDPKGRVIPLKKLQSLMYYHGDTERDEPKDIIEFRVDGRKHRLGFDDAQDYNRWRFLLDEIYNSSVVETVSESIETKTGVNLLYESVSAMRYVVQFADASTRNILSLPDSPCELILDADKIVLEQRKDKQYTIPRSTIHSFKLRNGNEVELKLGSRAPVTGTICFVFQSNIDAQNCLSQWDTNILFEEEPKKSPAPPLKQQLPPPSTTDNKPTIPPRINTTRKEVMEPPRPAPRSTHKKSLYYNAACDVTSQNDKIDHLYTPFTGSSKVNE